MYIGNVCLMLLENIVVCSTFNDEICWPFDHSSPSVHTRTALLNAWFGNEANWFDTIYSSIDFRKSTPPPNCQLNIFISKSE